MAGGGKGGSQSSQVEIPAWMEDYYKQTLAEGQQLAKLPYAPYSGPQVAAFTPMQEIAMQSQMDAAAAYGLAPKGANVMQGMPEAETFANGVRGYSSMPLFQQAVAELERTTPNYMEAYRQMYPVNRATGDAEQVLPYYYPQDYSGEINYGSNTNAFDSQNTNPQYPGFMGRGLMFGAY